MVLKYDEIIEAHRLTGSSADYMLKIVAKSIEDYDKFQQILIKNIEFNNAGEYALKITGGAASVDIIDCKFRYNGWNGSNLNTILFL